MGLLGEAWRDAREASRVTRREYPAMRELRRRYPKKYRHITFGADLLIWLSEQEHERATVVDFFRALKLPSLCFRWVYVTLDYLESRGYVIKGGHADPDRMMWSYSITQDGRKAAGRIKQTAR